MIFTQAEVEEGRKRDCLRHEDSQELIPTRPKSPRETYRVVGYHPQWWLERVLLSRAALQQSVGKPVGSGTLPTACVLRPRPLSGACPAVWEYREPSPSPWLARPLTEAPALWGSTFPAHVQSSRPVLASAEAGLRVAATIGRGWGEKPDPAERRQPDSFPLWDEGE